METISRRAVENPGGSRGGTPPRVSSPLPDGLKSPARLLPSTFRMPEIHLDSMLRRFGPPGSTRVDADTVEQLLDELERQYPGLRFKIRDETGALRRYVRVFVDGEDVSGTTGVATSLSGVRSVDILHSIAGG